ncbi:hypothetical protein O5O45_05695 [Hahella aquimaris]|uniref:hypothetical protein n=1 Tax=Hahella sp. HNIBRBA332 TaxID=3015983 RepID=UPI00273CC6BF|nr:hypothetical protein [Hahella sp. HNIBRBA332]WLQ15411.1 hypothetical protein O5O45_05695 [Hahella sp. HNIBRBA332]
MNSVILHFDISKEEVLHIASSVGILNGECNSKDGDRFLLWIYKDYESEYEEDEKEVVESMLGCKPVSSFQLLCRYASGHLALQKVMEIFSASNGVLDDDNDGYWRLKDIELAYGFGVEATIYNISDFIS